MMSIVGMVGERCCCCERVVISRVGRLMVLEETVVFVWWKQGGPILDSKNYRNGELQSPTEHKSVITLMDLNY